MNIPSSRFRDGILNCTFGNYSFLINIIKYLDKQPKQESCFYFNAKYIDGDMYCFL